MRYVTCLTLGLTLFAAGFIAFFAPGPWLRIAGFPWASILGLLLFESRVPGKGGFR